MHISIFLFMEVLGSNEPSRVTTMLNLTTL